MNEVLRREVKYMLTSQSMARLRYSISQVMHQDVNNRGEGYPIRSLYFDTLDDDDYADKENGIEIRRKIRLRNYGADTDFAILEMKQKQGDNQRKRSLRLTRQDSKRLITGDYSVLLNYKESFAAECFALMSMRGYRPKAVVEYKRMAFVAKENKIRITFDQNIVGTESNFDIFSTELLQNQVLNPYFTVLEVKYNGFLPSYIKDLLKECNESSQSVGKYVMSRAVSKHYRF